MSVKAEAELQQDHEDHRDHLDVSVVTTRVISRPSTLHGFNMALGQRRGGKSDASLSGNSGNLRNVCG